MSSNHDVNYDRLNILRSKFPRAALELDLVSGRVDPEIGKENPNFKPDDLQDQMEYNVLEVLDLIDEQGHTGFSHGYLVSLLIPLLKTRPITPLTGKDWEWNKPHFDDADQQNKRCPKVFRRNNNTAYIIDGFAFSDDGGKNYYTSKESYKDIDFPYSSKDLETKYVILSDGELNGQIRIFDI